MKPARILLAALAVCALAAPALAMGQRPTATPAPASPSPGAPASIVEMEEAAGHVLILGPRVDVKTDKGTFTIVTFPQEAPRSVERLLELARAKFYDGQAFHRVVPGFVAQMGDPQTKTLPVTDPKVGTGGSGKKLPAEFRGQRPKHLAGTVGIARGKTPESGDSQFYVTLAPVRHLNGQYTVVGHVVAGMDVVRLLQRGDRVVSVTVR